MQEHDLLVEGCLKVIGHDGMVLDFPLQIPLHRALSPSFLPMAQLQFGTVINDLFVRPATIALIAHIESVQAAQG